MDTPRNAPPAPPRHPIQDFIFGRELSEIYLLLDHISGRPDKSFSDVRTRADGTDRKKEIEDICKIGWPWPPRPTPEEQAIDAAKLIHAKDWLNAAARPATGATVAFTLMVVGDDPDNSPARRPSLLRRLLWGAPPEDEPSPVPSQRGAPAPPAAPESGWPSRLSLSRTAFPGLVLTAWQFKRNLHRMMGFLVTGLAATCLLSWYVAFGNDILGHLDGIHARRTEAHEKLTSLCDVQPDPAGGKPDQFVSPCSNCPTEAACISQNPALAAQARRLQDTLARLQLEHEAVSKALHHWVLPQSIFSGVRDGADHHERSGDSSVGAADFSVEETDETRLDEEVLRLWTHILASSVLPIFYGCLGAAVAVVRDLWTKVRESTLSPRDFTLAIGQLGLGITIGACISLFYRPAMPSPGNLADASVLTAAAVSFLAGFGVEAVFSTLENVVRRVFNTPGPAAR